MSGNTNSPTFNEGDRLSGFKRQVTPERISAYADASGDHNPVHLDPEYAKTTQFGGVIAHGMLSMAFVSELMAANFPDTWHSGGKMKLRFKAPVFPGETLEVTGQVQSVKETENGIEATCSVACLKPDGTEALSGTVNVRLQ
jgi:3-hydroxybutyryl-CoA dehydratase